MGTRGAVWRRRVRAGGSPGAMAKGASMLVDGAVMRAGAMHTGGTCGMGDVSLQMVPNAL